MSIHRVGVVGCGLMGAGIAEVCARAGADVTVVESGDDTLATDAGASPAPRTVRSPQTS